MKEKEASLAAKEDGRKSGGKGAGRKEAWRQRKERKGGQVWVSPIDLVWMQPSKHIGAGEVGLLYKARLPLKTLEDGCEIVPLALHIQKQEKHSLPAVHRQPTSTVLTLVSGITSQKSIKKTRTQQVFLRQWVDICPLEKVQSQGCADSRLKTEEEQSQSFSQKKTILTKIEHITCDVLALVHRHITCNLLASNGEHIDTVLSRVSEMYNQDQDEQLKPSKPKDSSLDIKHENFQCPIPHAFVVKETVLDLQEMKRARDEKSYIHARYTISPTVSGPTLAQLPGEGAHTSKHTERETACHLLHTNLHAWLPTHWQQVPSDQVQQGAQDVTQKFLKVGNDVRARARPRPGPNPQATQTICLIGFLGQR
eukprot:scaffold57380_cov22-Tisochrysis_lutea.AAC.1